MAKPPSRLQKLWNFLAGRLPHENRDGTVTTRHGLRIIPYRLTATRGGAVCTNLPEFLAQPRVQELYLQMQAIVGTPPRNKFVLDETTGDFFLKSDIQQHGARRAKPLGQIDVETEKALFVHAGEMAMRDYHFGLNPQAPRRSILDAMTGKRHKPALPPPPKPKPPKQP